MKRTLFALAFVTLVCLAAPRARAEVDVSIDFFYNNLGDDGSWIDVGDYGYCWQPSVAVSNPKWRPYADGYWAYTDVGWTWVSYEDFGWATYHYGRWARLADQGWVWVPGYEWGPAWVSWRTGGDQIGWAPLPPRYRSGGGGEFVYEGRPITGRVDIDFDIGPSYYNFVDVRYIGAPVLREHIYESSQNITYINRTVNVTNITYNNSVVYNYGPDYEQLNRYSTRPIQRLSLQREQNFDANVVRQRGEFSRVQGNNLVISGPQTLQRRSERLAPKNVRRKIEKPDFQTGWMGVTDAKAKADLQEKMKKEDLKAVPPPQTAPANAATPGTAAAATSPGAPVAASPASAATPVAGSTPPAPPASPAMTARPVPAATAVPEDRQGRRQRRDGNRAAQPTASPQAAVTAPDATATPPPQATAEPGRRGDRRNGGRQVPQPDAPPQTDVPAPNATAAPVPPSDGSRGQRRAVQPVPTIAPVAPSPSGVGAITEPGRDNENRARGLYAPNAGQSSDGSKSGGRGSLKNERLNVPPPVDPSVGAPAIQGQSQEPARLERNARRGSQVPPQQVAPQTAPPNAPAAPQGQGRGQDQVKPVKGKNKKAEEPAPSPAPGQ